MSILQIGPVLYCGDPHGQFRHIIQSASRTGASTVVLLGDLEPRRSLEEELAPLVEQGVAIYFIHGNHDADSDELAERVWSCCSAGLNVHGRVVTLPDGTRLAGLGGVFRESIWHPSSASLRGGVPAFRTRAEHARVTPRQDRWKGGPPRKHLGSIYPEDIERLAELRADVLVTHEAPGYHRYGVELLDTLAHVMGVKVLIHGHQHDRQDSSAAWAAQGFKSFGVGLRGITAIDRNGLAQVLLAGELDHMRDKGSVDADKQ